MSSDNSILRAATLSSVFTCVYFSVLAFIVLYYRSVYNIGKRSCLPLILGIILAECLKLSIFQISDNTNVREKLNKVKKYNFKSKLKSLLIIFAMVVIYYVVAILFGAPFLSEQEETLMFSILLTSLTAVPSCLNLGAEATIFLFTNITSFQGDIVSEIIKQNVSFTLIGAWLGAIVIPLDWDRPWQVWPIPCSLGAVSGYMCSHIVVLINIVPKFTKLFIKKTGKYGL